ncbi:hypothetical protein PTW35_13155 [Photobacterium sp. DA100]|uniref:lipopolysaccharide biosynthesis protein n=1 Tax=Photobacterium sp. DA100 TaxID=3027472 RepID=UPI0024786DB9|nr:hypothetical protein [Photobacterium sp. DA100]WEM41557.1 hypothetical protein PTW35_13155 [Photobacterium sp. DA100]
MRILKFFSYTFISAIIYALTQWGIVSAISHIKGVEWVGVYAFALSLVLPINMFFNFGVRQLISTEKNDVDINSYCLSILVSQALGLLVCIAFSYLFYQEYLYYVVCLYVVKICESLAETVYGYRQWHDNYRAIATSKICRSILLFASISVSLLAGLSLLQSVQIQVIAAVISIFLLDVRKVSVKSGQILKQQFYLLGLPLAVAATLLSVKTMFPRFFMEYYASNFELGVFASMMYFVSAGGLVITAFSQVLVPIVARTSREKKIKVIYGGFLGSLLLGSGLSLFIYLFGEWVFKVIYGDGFVVNHSQLLYLLLIITTTFVSSYLGYIASALRVLKQQPLIYIFIILVMFIAFYLLKSFISVVDSIYLVVIVGNIVQFFLLLYLVKIGLTDESSSHS